MTVPIPTTIASALARSAPKTERARTAFDLARSVCRFYHVAADERAIGGQLSRQRDVRGDAVVERRIRGRVDQSWFTVGHPASLSTRPRLAHGNGVSGIG